MDFFEKLYKKICWIIFNTFKPKGFGFLRYENFLNVFKFYESNFPNCGIFELKAIPYNKKRYELLAEQIGTAPTEAFFIIKAIHESLSIEGVCCEFGVAQGQTSSLMANELLNFSDKKLYLFDSFQGLPSPTEEDELIDDIFNLGEMKNYVGAMKSPKESVLNKLSDLNFSSDRFKIFSGFIDQNFSKIKNLPDKVSFAYIDFDFYEPIKIVLEFLIDKTDKGSFIIIDDYDFFSSGVKLAVDNFLKINQNLFNVYVAPKLIGNFIVLKRIK